MGKGGGTGIVIESISCQIDLYPAVFVQDTTLRYGFPYAYLTGLFTDFILGVLGISAQENGLL